MAEAGVFGVGRGRGGGGFDEADVVGARGADVEEAGGEEDGLVFVHEVFHTALEAAHDVGVGQASPSAADRLGAFGVVLNAVGDEELGKFDAFVAGGVPLPTMRGAPASVRPGPETRPSTDCHNM